MYEIIFIYLFFRNLANGLMLYEKKKRNENSFFKEFQV